MNVEKNIFNSQRHEILLNYSNTVENPSNNQNATFSSKYSLSYLAKLFLAILQLNEIRDHQYLHVI